jgi:hypothetical protein
LRAARKEQLKAACLAIIEDSALSAAGDDRAAGRRR